MVPGNDDAMKAIRLYAAGVADAVIEGKAVVPQVPAGEDEFVELDEEGNVRRKGGAGRPAPRRAAPARRKPARAPRKPADAEVEVASAEAEAAPAESGADVGEDIAEKAEKAAEPARGERAESDDAE